MRRLALELVYLSLQKRLLSGIDSAASVLKKTWFKQLTNLRFSTSAYAITIGKTTNLTSVWGTLVVGRWYLGPHCTMDIGKRLVHVKSYGDVVAVTSFVNMNTDSVDRSGTKLTSKSHLRMRVAGSMQFVQDWDRDETSHQFGCGLRWIVVSSASRKLDDAFEYVQFIWMFCPKKVLWNLGCPVETG